MQIFSVSVLAQTVKTNSARFPGQADLRERQTDHSSKAKTNKKKTKQKKNTSQPHKFVGYDTKKK